MNGRRRVRVFQVDVFTTQLYAGNPAGVVLDAQDLDEREMQLIARELGSADTAFVLPPDAPDHDLRLRFYTPRGETGFVGHATIAAHAVLDSLGLPHCPRQKHSLGLAGIERLPGPQGTRYAFSRPPPQARDALGPEALVRIGAALGVRATEFDSACPAVVAGATGTRALIAVRDGAVLARLKPDLAALSALSGDGGPPGFFVYTLAPAVADCDTEARMFCPALGIDEDPVSGNAHTLLAMHLLALNRVPERGGQLEFTGRQGHHIGRAGEVEVRIRRESGLVSGVRVAGAARVVYGATIDPA